MNVIIAGRSGMIGKLILNDCIGSEKIESITSLVRRPSKSTESAKIKEVLIQDFGNYAGQEGLFQNMDVGFFCIGAYTGQVTNEQFQKITVDYAVAFAEALKEGSPKSTLCMLSGAGADRTEKSKTAFARLKGMAENRISKLGLNFYAFRPGYIYPVTPRTEPNLMYSVSRLLYPLIKLMGSNMSIKSTELAKAMLKVGISGAEKEVLENRDIISQLKS